MVVSRMISLLEMPILRGSNYHRVFLMRSPVITADKKSLATEHGKQPGPFEVTGVHFTSFLKSHGLARGGQRSPDRSGNYDGGVTSH